jgi:predicted nucleic acid-binding protein
LKCLDTTFLVDIVEQPDETKQVASELEARGEVLATTAFNAYEALLGVHSLRDQGQRAKLLDLYAKVLSRLVVLPISLEDAAKAAEIGGELRRKGREVGADSLTAAIALRGGCDGIVTRNVSHYERIEELTGLAVIPY